MSSMGGGLDDLLGLSGTGGGSGGVVNDFAAPPAPVTTGKKLFFKAVVAWVKMD